MDNRVRRALVSVYDKDGVVDFCRTLADLDVEILSSGGTARLLRENDIQVTLVSDYTGFPEMLEGRVKTLHPKVHGGILAIRDNAGHMKDLSDAKIDPIDLVVVNLYPFEKTASIDGIGLGEVVEMIDIGGPAMVRAAAKNFAHVGVVVNPGDYAEIAAGLRQDGGLSAATRHQLAVKAFRHTAGYDHAVYSYLEMQGSDGAQPKDESPFPATLQLDFIKSEEMRYGENPHQKAAFYRDPVSRGPSIGRAKQLQGKPLSFNNILDFNAALSLAAEFRKGACAIIKHGNPCGTALGSDPAAAFKRALECDPLSAFGGVIAFNRPVDLRAATAIKEQFYEGVIAPEFDTEARELLAKKKKLRLLEVGDLSGYRPTGFDLRRVDGGLLVQDWDSLGDDVRACKVATGRKPTDDEWKALEFGWVVCKHVKSNAIVFTQPDRTIGVGAGQMSRVDSVRLGVQKAQVPTVGSAMASDAFFPFRDGIDQAAEAGVTAVIQPGGSIRDDEVIAACDEHDIAMVFTGRRHFRH